MRTLYFECYSGISGDMTVASLLDLGADKEVLLKGLKSLNVDGYDIKISRVNKSGIDACDFDVVLDHDHDHDEHSHSHDHDEHSHDHGHDHDHDEHTHSHDHNHDEHSHDHGEHSHSHDHDEHSHDHGHDHSHDHGEHSHSHDHDEHSHSHDHDEHSHSHDHDHDEHSHSHDHDHDEHSHDHDHDEHSHSHPHEHRGLNDILRIIEHSQITDNAKAMASKIFKVIAKAEATVHGVPMEEIHFHEVGAVDSIVDIVGAAICIDNLKVDKIIASTVFEGTGYVKCQHGLMPVPAPATAKIIGEHGIPMKITANKGEMVTPTGAGILAALCAGYKLPESFIIENSGFGAGKKEFLSANVLRAYIINEQADIEESIIKLETNIDDMTGEELSYAMEKLFIAGARDVYFTPIYMKKNRPATIVSVLCKNSEKETMCELLFKHTSTIGVRVIPIERVTMERSTKTVKTSLGEAEIKVCSYKGFTKKTVEFESAKRIADEKNLSISEVCTKIKSEVQ